jgi:hypothetical protein
MKLLVFTLDDNQHGILTSVCVDGVWISESVYWFLTKPEVADVPSGPSMDSTPPPPHTMQIKIIMASKLKSPMSVSTNRC